MDDDCIGLICFSEKIVQKANVVARHFYVISFVTSKNTAMFKNKSELNDKPFFRLRTGLTFPVALPFPPTLI